MNAITSYVVIGEDGGHSALTGDPKASVAGAAARLKSQGRRGYIAQLVGDSRTGTLTLVEGVNDPQVDFDEVKTRFAERNKTRGASNSLFRRVGGGSGA